MTLYNLLLGTGITFSIYLIASFCFQKKGKRRNRILLFFLFSFLQGINFHYNIPLLFFFIYITLLFCFLRLSFHTYFHNLLFLGMILFLICFSFEALFYITLSLFHIRIPSLIIIYLFSMFLTFLTAFFFKEPLKEHLTKAFFFTNKKVIPKYLLTNLTLFYILAIRLARYNLSLEFYYLFSFLFIILFNMTLLLLREKEKTRLLQLNLNKTIEYTEFTENLLMEYKSFSHEYKNQLIIIKSMTNQKNKEIHSYIDNILQEKAINNYRWLIEIKSIPITGIKGLINFKLLKMKELHIDVEVYIAEDIANLKKEFLTPSERNSLNTIMGILFDNAIEASLESKNKMASFQMYKEKNSIVILLANTFKSINIEQMEEKGYSTKGKNRGYGLSILNDEIKHHDKFTKETSIFENFFIQKISIQLLK